LISKWDAEDYEVRAAASQELVKIGLVAEPYLRQAIKDSPSAEVRLRAREARTAIRSPKTPVHLFGHIETILCAAFSPDSKTLATGAQDGQVIFWDLSNCQIKSRLSWPAKSP
jgi:WD40 repeat protein